MSTVLTRRTLATVAAAALGLSLTACSALSSNSSESASPDAAATDAMSTDPSALAVSVSFYPIQYLAEQIGGSHVNVTSVTPTNVEPHDYELAPSDVQALSSASLITYVKGFQPSMDDAVDQVSGPTVLDLSSSVDLVHHEGVEEEHKEGETHEADDASSLDPHFWLDPVRMKDAAKAIEQSLSQADPDHAADYQANLATLTSTLDGLDSSYSNGLHSCERTTFVTSHAAFGYLADRYGLTQAPISGIDPEAEPSPADLADIKKVVEDTGTTTIFTEDLVSPETAEALANETGATTEVLTPLESAPEGGDYQSAMKDNLDKLQTALACK